MTGALVWFDRFAGSLAGRLALLLASGVASAAILSLFLAEHGRIHDFRRARQDQIIASTADIADRLTLHPEATNDLLQHDRILGARIAPPTWAMTHPDSEISRRLQARLGLKSDVEAMAMPPNACFPRSNLAIRAAGVADPILPECWFVQFHDNLGAAHRLLIDVIPLRIPPSSTLALVPVILVIIASTVVSLIVAGLISRPLNTLIDAARRFSVTIDPEPIPEKGPREVRIALETFNLMQNRVREGFKERTQILAAVTHDLQTPLTRLRLRLEQVPDAELRDKLIADLASTQQLVRDGLELAGSSESREPWSVVDVDSILSSVAEDAAEFGAAVRFVSGCGVEARVKPGALSRCLVNLVNNAVKYAGDAELSCTCSKRALTIAVRDHGRGIPESMLDDVFKPFHRLDGTRYGAPGGSGLGLAIAKAQAETFGAILTLANHPDGGLVACVVLDI